MKFEDYINNFIQYVKDKYNLQDNYKFDVEFYGTDTAGVVLTEISTGKNNTVLLNVEDMGEDYKNLFKSFADIATKDMDVMEKESITQPAGVSSVSEAVSSENKKGILVGDIYNYVPSYDPEQLGNSELETELAQISKFEPLCKIEDTLITSSEDEDQLLLVTFDIPENSDKNLPDFVKGKSYVIFDSDVKNKQPIEEGLYSDSEGPEQLPVDFPEHEDAIYAVKSYTINGNGEVELLTYDKSEDEDFYKYVGALDSWMGIKNLLMLTHDPLFSMDQDIYAELRQKAVDIANVTTAEPKIKESVAVKEEIVDDQGNMSQALLRALESEREAVSIYEMLIKMSVDEDEIELLNKILKDEKEHIALLAGLQTKSTAQFVEPDNKDELDDYAQEVIETAPASESGEDGD